MVRTYLTQAPTPSPITQVVDEIDDKTFGLPPSEISSLSDNQDVVLAFAPIIPSLLSIFGSTMIIYMVINSKKQSPYRRLLLYMSICDIFNSATLPLWSFLLPKNSSQHIWAIGTDATCTMLGFSTQSISFIAVFYNACLSYYFLYTIRYNMKEHEFAKRVEPYLHFISIGFPLTTAIIGVIVGVFHEMELGVGCWVTNYPEGCGDDTIDGDFCHALWIAALFGGIPLLFLMISLIVNNIKIYQFVRQTIQTSQRHNATISQSTQAKRIKAVAMQAFLYVGACFISYVWTFILRMLEGISFSASSEAKLFWLLLAQAICLPIQGFFNFLIYIRPKYIRMRNEYPEKNIWWTIQQCIIRGHDRNSQNNNATSNRPSKTGTNNNASQHSTNRRFQQKRRQNSTTSAISNNNGSTTTKTTSSRGRFSAVLFFESSRSFRSKNKKNTTDYVNNNNNDNNNTHHHHHRNPNENHANEDDKKLDTTAKSSAASTKSVLPLVAASGSSRSLQLSLVSSLPSIMEEEEDDDDGHHGKDNSSSVSASEESSLKEQAQQKKQTQQSSQDNATNETIDINDSSGLSTLSVNDNDEKLQENNENENNIIIKSHETSHEKNHGLFETACNEPCEIITPKNETEKVILLSADEVTHEWLRLKQFQQEQEELDLKLRLERQYSDELSEWSRE